MPRSFQQSDRIDLELDASRATHLQPWFTADDPRSVDQRVDAYLEERFGGLLTGDEVAFLRANKMMRSIIKRQWQEVVSAQVGRMAAVGNVIDLNAHRRPARRKAA